MLSKFITGLSFFLFSVSISGQPINDSINEDYVKKALNFLASNELRGRVNYSYGQLQAAEYIANEFNAYRLEPFPGVSNYYIPFERQSGSGKKTPKLYWNGKEVNDSLILFFPHNLVTTEKTLENYMVLQVSVPIADSLLLFNWNIANRDLLLWLNLPEGVSFSEAIARLLIPASVPASDILIAGVKDKPVKLIFTGNQKSGNNNLYNIVGVMPGKSLANEFIIFSAHYDHVSIGVHGETGLFNGANDDASGTVAVMALARYYSMRRDNERTLIFCLFAGEELGLLGSNNFARLVKPESIKAVINIEMIGMTNAVGKDAFMVTGSSYSNLVHIITRNLKDQKFSVKRLEYDPTQLFRRSDNYSFAQYGIPAHTLMCSDDKEPCYHRTCDDVKRIDIANMTRVIRAIAIGSSSLISGEDTPSRIKNIN
ncbi:MAG TPA: M28 family peptidase [Chitinophagaceae bacterium]|nr:M28 family peptidase [Chitinophagaceae bacterium]